MGGDQGRLLGSHHPDVGLGQDVVDRAREVEADDEGGEEGVDGPDQPGPQLDDVVHQRRLGGVDVLLRHSAALDLTADVSGAAGSTGRASRAGALSATSDVPMSEVPAAGAGRCMAGSAALVTSSRIMAAGSKAPDPTFWLSSAMLAVVF